MSILIKGMEMPENCSKCGFLKEKTFLQSMWNEVHDGWMCSITKDSIELYEEPPIDCPLVELPEKHGRLIDADRAISILLEKAVKAVEEKDVVKSFGLGVATGFISKAPTVIEAEGRE